MLRTLALAALLLVAALPVSGGWEEGLRSTADTLKPVPLMI